MSMSIQAGIVGWCASTGNGGWDYDLARLCPWITKWLCPKHPHKEYHKSYWLDKCTPCARANDIAKYQQFLEGLDAVLFIERPYIDKYNLVGECKRRGIKTIYCPMWEWHRTELAWVSQVDVIWVVTRFTERYIRSCEAQNKAEIFYLTWGCDVNTFKFQRREKCTKFLFMNGNGGVLGRKGLEVILEVSKKAHDLPITIATQKAESIRDFPNVTVINKNFESREEVYNLGDVLIAPSFWEGWGHQLYEAQACGLPVITTDAAPMNECGTDWLVKLQEVGRINLGGKVITRAKCNINDLILKMRMLYGEDISKYSEQGRKRMEERFDINKLLIQLEEKIVQLVAQ